MRLYTICIHQRPVLVISTDTDTPMLDEFTTNSELMKSTRESRALRDALPEAVRRIDEQREIDEALDTWLRDDLRSLENDGRRLWDGARASLYIRDATTDEAERWHTSRRAAIDTGEVDAGDEDWLIFLVSVAEASRDRRKPKPKRA